ncbi:hypothetical protein ACFLR2_01730 [Chlamydiota bacterium]
MSAFTLFGSVLSGCEKQKPSASTQTQAPAKEAVASTASQPQQTTEQPAAPAVSALESAVTPQPEETTQVEPALEIPQAAEINTASNPS